MEQLRFEFAEAEDEACPVLLDLPQTDDLIGLMAAAIAAVVAKGADDGDDARARGQQDHGGAP
jgi:hypothetical protein